MSKPISAGDLVAVIRGCPACGVCRSRGMFLVVENVAMSVEGSCGECGDVRVEDDAYLDNGRRIPLSRLKRIPPLGELEGEKQKEDLREPA